MADKASKAGLPAPVEVESNHNTLTAPKPVALARVAEVPDYNPQRRTPNKANLASDTTTIAETANDLVDAKGDRPYRANVEAESKTVAETSAASDLVKEQAVKVSREAAAEPQVYRDRLPAEVSNDAVPAEDSGLGG